MNKYILSLILIAVLLAAFTACSFDPDTTIFDTDDDDDDDDDNSGNTSKSTFGGPCTINSDCADPFQCNNGVCGYSMDDDDDSVNYETHADLCETYEICTPARGTYMCMVTKDSVSPNIPRCDANTGEGCSEGQIPLMVTFGAEPECGCVTICGKGSGKYGDSACSAGEDCTLQGSIYICTEDEEIPSDTNLCNIETGEGCDNDEIPLTTEYEGNPVCICLQGC